RSPSEQPQVRLVVPRDGSDVLPVAVDSKAADDLLLGEHQRDDVAADVVRPVSAREGLEILEKHLAPEQAECGKDEVARRSLWLFNKLHDMAARIELHHAEQRNVSTFNLLIGRREGRTGSAMLGSPLPVVPPVDVV